MKAVYKPAYTFNSLKAVAVSDETRKLYGGSRFLVWVVFTVTLEMTVSPDSKTALYFY